MIDSILTCMQDEIFIMVPVISATMNINFIDCGLELSQVMNMAEYVC